MNNSSYVPKNVPTVYSGMLTYFSIKLVFPVCVMYVCGCMQINI